MASNPRNPKVDRNNLTLRRVVQQLEEEVRRRHGTELTFEQVQKDAGHASEGGEGVDVAAQEALDGLVEGEAGEDCAGEGEHQHEAGQGAPRMPDGDLAEAAPVDLALLASQRAAAQVSLCVRGRAHGLHIAADLHLRARVAAVMDHLVEAAGTQPRVVLERLADEEFIGVEL